MCYWDRAVAAPSRPDAPGAASLRGRQLTAVSVSCNEDHSMTCRRFVSDVIDVAREVPLEPARHEAVLAHLRTCASCTALAERQRVMSIALRRVADEQR